MAALEAAVQVKMAAASEEKGNKQSARLRLIADPAISVKSIQAVLSKYVEFKEEKHLWSLVCPPASGPCSYGWHTRPDAQWLMKVSGLLYDLLAVCPNTKLVSKKVVAALKAMQTSFVADFPRTKYVSSSDLIDKVDVTLRVLLSMLRQLKCSCVLRSRTYRMLSKAEQCKLNLLLDRVVLPAELIGDENFEDDLGPEGDIYMTSFEGSEKTLDVASAVMSAQLVPVAKEPVKTPDSSRHYALQSQSLQCRAVQPLPSIFGKILAQNGSSAVPVGVPQPSKPASSLLALAMNHAPKATLKEQKIPSDKKGKKMLRRFQSRSRRKPNAKKVSRSKLRRIVPRRRTM